MQKLYSYRNGYGASVVQNGMSYGGREGKFELAVIKFDSTGQWDLCYTTPITSDVIGWLTWEEVEALLRKIEAL